MLGESIVSQLTVHQNTCLVSPFDILSEEVCTTACCLLQDMGFHLNKSNVQGCYLTEKMRILKGLNICFLRLLWTPCGKTAPKDSSAKWSLLILGLT